MIKLFSHPIAAEISEMNATYWIPTILQRTTH